MPLVNSQNAEQNASNVLGELMLSNSCSWANASHLSQKSRNLSGFLSKSTLALNHSKCSPSEDGVSVLMNPKLCIHRPTSCIASCRASASSNASAPLRASASSAAEPPAGSRADSASARSQWPVSKCCQLRTRNHELVHNTKRPLYQPNLPYFCTALSK